MFLFFFLISFLVKSSRLLLFLVSIRGTFNPLCPMWGYYCTVTSFVGVTHAGAAVTVNSILLLRPKLTLKL